jgi:2-oxoacid:acceptor oxidoreductase gamma subunit (pyruvate/2-ketoisovalerate family)
MIEIRFHGRGGQGAVTASEIIAIAAFKDGKYSHAFPSFGPERTGAPVEAYSRIDDKFINIRTHVYEPDYLIVLDPSLLYAVDVTKGLKKGGIIVINSEKPVKVGEFKVFNVDATKIANEILGKPIVNTAMLGAFIKATGLITMKNLEEAIKERFPKELAEKNIAAIRKSHEGCR